MFVISKIKKRVSLFFMVSVLFFLMSSSAYAAAKTTDQDLNPGLGIEISLEKQVYALNETVEIRGRIKNATGQTIWLQPPMLTLNFDIYLKDKKMPKAERIGPMAFIHYYIGKENIIKLEPEEDVTFTERLDQKFFTKPDKVGHHELFVVYDERVEEFEGIKMWTGTLRSNVVNFTVVEEK